MEGFGDPGAEFDDAGIAPNVKAGAGEVAPEPDTDAGGPNIVGALGVDADSAGFFGASA